MPSIRRVLFCLPLAAAGSALWSLPSASQGRAVEGVSAPLLRAVARMTCGTPRPRGYALATPSLRPGGSGAGSLAALGQHSILGSAELVGTLELSFGGEPRRGAAAAERPQGGSWTVPQTGYCVGGRGPLQLAVITPAENGGPARFELRGPANRIQRPGGPAMAEGGEVRFTGSCGRRQEVVMEIWPPVVLETGQGRAEPERYYLVGNVSCAGAAPGAGAPDTTPTATP
jgi:hypothetical protein